MSYVDSTYHIDNTKIRWVDTQTWAELPRKHGGDINNTLKGATSVSLTDMSYIDSTQPQAKLIMPK